MALKILMLKIKHCHTLQKQKNAPYLQPKPNVMRLVLFFIISLFVFSPIVAQKTHQVQAKESFTSIGRQYNVNGRVLAEYNKLNYEKGLAIGQVIKIPNTVATPTVTVPVVATPAPVAKPAGNNPVYHTVAAKETMYGLSKKYAVSIADLKKWNNTTADGFAIGTIIIVGYGAVATETAPAAAQAQPPAAVKPAEKPITKPVETTPTVAPTEPALKPVVQAPIKPVVAPTISKENTTQTNTDKEPIDFAGGAFKNSFTSNNTTAENGKASVFLSLSGWDDGRYYCLHNQAAQGSIAKITNNTTGKTIFAKVIDVMPDIKKNKGTLLRVSNAAASELGVNTDAFDCTIVFVK
jgi:LysM repeat protein